MAPVALLLAVALAACGSAVAPSPSNPPETPVPTPTAVPGDPGSGGGSGNTGSGIVIPIPGDPGSNPLLGKATYVSPVQDLVNLHPVNVQLVRATVNADGRTSVDVRWWGGIAPCTQLSTIQIDRDDAAKTVRLTVIEGSGGGQIACIDIAQLTGAEANLQSLGSGTWTISAMGDAPAITLSVP